MAAIIVFETPFPTLRRLVISGFLESYDYSRVTSVQLFCIVKETDNSKRRLAPQKASVLLTAKTILNGLTSIMNHYPDLPQLPKPL